jgi:hypothetical protein
VRPRTELTLAVLLCAAGAALVLLAAGRAWVVEIVARPAPLPDEQLVRRGGELVPWLPALGWLGLAGAGALLATSGRARRVVGMLLALAAVAVAAGAVRAAGHGDSRPGWAAVVCGAGALALAAAGVLAVVKAGGWPSLGGRYERGGGRTGAGPDRSRRPLGPDDPPETLWDALDRGHDPTAAPDVAPDRPGCGR